MSSKKYHSHLEQADDGWTAKIIRQVSKHKTHVSKQQSGFASEAEAQAWADTALNEFVSAQQKANARHGEQRKEAEEVKRQRSERRGEKTEAAKKAREQEVAENADLTQEQ